MPTQLSCHIGWKQAGLGFHSQFFSVVHGCQKKPAKLQRSLISHPETFIPPFISSTQCTEHRAHVSGFSFFAWSWPPLLLFLSPLVFATGCDFLKGASAGGSNNGYLPRAINYRYVYCSIHWLPVLKQSNWGQYLQRDWREVRIHLSGKSYLFTIFCGTEGRLDAAVTHNTFNIYNIYTISHFNFSWLLPSFL